MGRALNLLKTLTVIGMSSLALPLNKLNASWSVTQAFHKTFVVGWALMMPLWCLFSPNLTKLLQSHRRTDLTRPLRHVFKVLIEALIQSSSEYWDNVIWGHSLSFQCLRYQQCQALSTNLYSPSACRCPLTAGRKPPSLTYHIWKRLDRKFWTNLRELCQDGRRWDGSRMWECCQYTSVRQRQIRSQAPSYFIQ